MLQRDRLGARSKVTGEDAEEDMLLSTQYGKEVKVKEQEEDRSKL